MSIRSYIDIVSKALLEGALIPYPDKMLRIAGSPLDFYQLLKMTANANLAHKVTYTQTGNRAGANITEVLMFFYDDQSFAETKQLFDHYGIAYTDEGELAREGGKKKKPFQSEYNPPDDADLLHG